MVKSTSISVSTLAPDEDASVLDHPNGSSVIQVYFMELIQVPIQVKDVTIHPTIRSKRKVSNDVSVEAVEKNDDLIQIAAQLQQRDV